MRAYLTFILITLMILLTNFAVGAELKVDSTRLINILGEVDYNILEKANELAELSKTPEPIYLLINSPGGSVAAGHVFIDSMRLAQKKGINIKCISTIYNASMAFSIFASCTERYALPNTSLLFHPVSTALSGRFGERRLTTIADELGKLDKDLQDFLIGSLGISKKLVMDTYYAEKWWTAVELNAVAKKGWMTIVDGLSGIPKPFIVEEIEGGLHGMELLPNFIHGR